MNPRDSDSVFKKIWWNETFRCLVPTYRGRSAKLGCLVIRMKIHGSDLLIGPFPILCGINFTWRSFYNTPEPIDQNIRNGWTWGLPCERFKFGVRIAPRLRVKVEDHFSSFPSHIPPFYALNTEFSILYISVPFLFSLLLLIVVRISQNQPKSTTQYRFLYPICISTLPSNYSLLFSLFQLLYRVNAVEERMYSTRTKCKWTSKV